MRLPMVAGLVFAIFVRQISAMDIRGAAENFRGRHGRVWAWVLVW